VKAASDPDPARFLTSDTCFHSILGMTGDLCRELLDNPERLQAAQKLLQLRQGPRTA